MSDWRPRAAGARVARARLLAELRGFFARRGVLEVETPILGRGTVLDPAMESWHAQAGDGAGGCMEGWLQTSPEYPMKRLLADGAGDIYQIARVFRGGESGVRHNPEFSLLEWYRLGLDDRMLADEVVTLLQEVAAADPAWHAPDPEPRVVAYPDLRDEALGVDALNDDAARLQAVAAERGLTVHGELDRDAWLDALVSLCVVPEFPPGRVTILHDYPESQAILARRSRERPGCAARCEGYWGDLDLANGYFERTDPAEFRRRREQDRALRRARGQPEPAADPFLEAALEAGLPDCAGVALGVDRLLMRLLGEDDIRRVIDFPWGCA